MAVNLEAQLNSVGNTSQAKKVLHSDDILVRTFNDPTYRNIEQTGSLTYEGFGKDRSAVVLLQSALVDCGFLKREGLTVGVMDDATEKALADLRKQGGVEGEGGYITHKTIDLIRLGLLANNVTGSQNKTLQAYRDDPARCRAAVDNLKKFYLGIKNSSGPEIELISTVKYRALQASWGEAEVSTMEYTVKSTIKDLKNAKSTIDFLHQGLSSAVNITTGEKAGTVKKFFKGVINVLASPGPEVVHPPVKMGKPENKVQVVDGYYYYEVGFTEPSCLDDEKPRLKPKGKNLGYVQVIDPKKVKLELVPALRATGEALAAVSEVVEKTGALGGCSGAFFNNLYTFGSDREFTEFLRGGVISNSEVIAPAVTTMPALGIWEDGTVRVGYVGPEEIHDPDSPWSQTTHLFQSPQLLLLDGKTNWPDYAGGYEGRIAMGVTAEGQVVVFATAVDLDFKELAGVMKNLGCVAAVNLDAGGTTQVVRRNDGNGQVDSLFGGRSIPYCFAFYQKK